MSNVVPIITAESHERLADREMIRRYKVVINGYSDEVRRLREEKRLDWWEAFVFGLAVMLAVSWLWQ